MNNALGYLTSTTVRHKLQNTGINFNYTSLKGVLVMILPLTLIYDISHVSDSYEG